MAALLKIFSQVFGGLATVDKLAERYDKYKAKKAAKKKTRFLRRYDSADWPE